MSADDFTMPYALSWYLESRDGYHISAEHRQPTGVSTGLRHHMVEGAYQIMVATIAGRGARIIVSGYSSPSAFTYSLITPDVDGKHRSGGATIYVPAGGGSIVCNPDDQTASVKPGDTLKTPLVMQIIPLESYKPWPSDG